MPTTPKLGLRYPAGGDAANGPLYFQQLAEDLEDLLYGSSDLAGTPLGTVIFNVRDAHFGRWLRLDGVDRTQAEIETALGLSAGDAADFAALMGTGGSSRYGSAAAGKIRIPDLRRRVPMAGGPTGDPAGGTARNVGDTGGADAVTLTKQQSGLPSHGHTGSQAAHSHAVTDSGHTHGGSSAAAGGHDHGAATGTAGAHDHGGSTGSVAAHNHGGSSGVAGGHNHGGVTTDESAHTHGVGSYAVASHAHSLSGVGATATMASAGSHSHGGATGGAGAHTHEVRWQKSGNTTATGSADRASSITNAVFNTSATATDDPGNHTHTISSDGSHTHALSGDTTSTSPAISGNSAAGSAHHHTITSVADHSHSISNDGAHSHTIANQAAHSHSITAVADHTHAITVSSSTTGITLGNATPAVTVNDNTGADAAQSHENLPPFLTVGHGFIRV